MKIKRICEACGKEFLVYPSVIKNGRGKTCSRDCKNKWHSHHVRGKNHPLWKEKVTIQCSYCGQTKRVFPNQARAKEFLFCNMKCQAEWQRENRSRENHPCWKGGGITVNCSHCGTEKQIGLWEKNESEKYFCDINCRAKWMSYNMQGEDNPSWKRGISFEPYPPKFNRTLRQEVRKRDGYKCIICGDKARLVHHIDYDKNNNDMENLITVCRSCHGKTNFDRENWKVLFFTWKAGCLVHDPED